MSSSIDDSTHTTRSFGGQSMYGGSQKSTHGIEIDMETMEKRRALEHELVMKHDKTAINTREECWYLMDVEWLYRWADFIAGNIDVSEVGRITTLRLLDPETKEPLQGLEPKINYRGIPQLAYYILKELHGKDSSPELCRFTLDIYQRPVPPEVLAKIRPPAINRARVLVHSIRKKWMKWELKQDDKEDEEDYVCCCGITKEHIEAFIYWAVMCCARRSSGRKDISYRQYKPLRNEDSAHGGNNSETVGVGTADFGEPTVELLQRQSQRSDSAAAGGANADGGDLERRYWMNSSLLQKLRPSWFV